MGSKYKHTSLGIHSCLGIVALFKMITPRHFHDSVFFIGVIHLRSTRGVMLQT